MCRMRRHCLATEPTLFISWPDAGRSPCEQGNERERAHCSDEPSEHERVREPASQPCSEWFVMQSPAPAVGTSPVVRSATAGAALAVPNAGLEMAAAPLAARTGLAAVNERRLVDLAIHPVSQRKARAAAARLPLYSAKSVRSALRRDPEERGALAAMIRTAGAGVASVGYAVPQRSRQRCAAMEASTTPAGVDPACGLGLASSLNTRPKRRSFIGFGTVLDGRR